MNRLYDTAREAFARGQIDWVGDTIVARLVRSSAYTPNFSTDQYLSIVPSDALASTAVTIASKTAAAGVLDAADVVFSSVAAGAAIDVILIYKDTGNSATSQLLMWIDTATSLPFTPDGTNVTAQWDNGSLRICQL